MKIKLINWLHIRFLSKYHINMKKLIVVNFRNSNINKKVRQIYFDVISSLQHNHGRIIQHPKIMRRFFNLPYIFEIQNHKTYYHYFSKLIKIFLILKGHNIRIWKITKGNWNCFINVKFLTFKYLIWWLKTKKPI